MKYIENDLPYETYYNLRASVGWENFSKKSALDSLAKSWYSILVKDQDQDIAMGRVDSDGKNFSIVDIIVRPDYQKKGIGKKIIKKITSNIRKNLPEDGQAIIRLLCARGKEGFYTGLGFRPIAGVFQKEVRK